MIKRPDNSNESDRLNNSINLNETQSAVKKSDLQQLVYLQQLAHQLLGKNQNKSSAEGSEKHKSKVSSKEEKKSKKKSIDQDSSNSSQKLS